MTYREDFYVESPQLRIKFNSSFVEFVTEIANRVSKWQEERENEKKKRKKNGKGTNSEKLYEFVF